MSKQDSKLYKWYDLQDNQDYYTGTLEDAKRWLLDFWEQNPFHEEDLEDMPEYSEEEHHEEIKSTQKPFDLNEMMGGIDWTLEEIGMNIEKIELEELTSRNIPTFNNCDHYYIEPQQDKMQTIVIKLENGKHLTVNINPESDNVDVKLHGEHSFRDFGTVKAFFNMRGAYDNE